MTSTGAGMPVQSSNEAAPWATSTSRPSTRAAPGRARRRVERRRPSGRYGEVDDRLPGSPSWTSTSSRTGVALTTRSRRPRPAATRRCARTHARRERVHERGRGAAAPITTGRVASIPRAWPRPSVEPSTRPSRRRACSPSGPGARQTPHARLCGIVTFAPAKPSAPSPRAASSRSVLRLERHVRPVEARAANAAFCIRGDSECATGLPIKPTSPRRRVVSPVGRSRARV